MNGLRLDYFLQLQEEAQGLQHLAAASQATADHCNQALARFVTVPS
jgi:hypothetical protein